MRLVVREYLSMLKESGELDNLLPDLLLVMGIDPLSRPARGSRQFGVDLPAVGVDPEDGRRKLFLFVVKQGDITRGNWDTGEQAVRPSLNEIFDVYLGTQVRPEHRSLPKKVVLVSNGEIRQNVEPNWAGYARERASGQADRGEMELQFWGADRLAALIEEYLLDEYLFPESAQKQIRKTIALADQAEDEPRFFYLFLEETLFQRGLPSEASPSAHRKRQHVFRLINLSVNIVFHWCQESENLRSALLCSERALLRTWDWMRQHQLFDAPTQDEFGRLHETYLVIAKSYAAKIRPHCFVRDGLFGYGADEVEYPLRTFEVIGILGELGMALAYRMAALEGESTRRKLLQEGEATVEALLALIYNNPSAVAPSYDGHAVDIGLGLLALAVLGSREKTAEWLKGLLNHTLFSYKIGRYFPISSDAFDDLLALRFDEKFPKDSLRNLSTLVPMLFDWIVVLDLREQYEEFREAVEKILVGVDLQVWFPDDETEEILYRSNAGHQGGRTLGSIRLPEQFDELKSRLTYLMGHSVFDQLSCIHEGWPALALIASRHFRTPLIPGYWLQSLISESDFSGTSAE